jgi:hypothetical protein
VQKISERGFETEKKHTEIISLKKYFQENLNNSLAELVEIENG